MKKALVLTLLSLGLFAEPAQASGVSFNLFYASLSPHGEWVALAPSFYAWRPHGMANGWRPYTMGSWSWTDDGWYWCSDEPWGWATYHYGRWYYDDYYGWIWIPGYDWAPAWVEWRYGRDCIGWAPLGPSAVISFSFGIHYRTHWVTPHFYWSFVDCGYMTSPGVNRYVYRTDDNTRRIGVTRGGGSVRNDGGRIVTRGPEREYVERLGSIKVRRAEVVDVDNASEARVIRSNSGERIDVYRPPISRRSVDEAVEQPENVRKAERTTDLDTRYTELRPRDDASGRDLRRAEEYRQRRSDTDVRENDKIRRIMPRVPSSGRWEPRIERAPEPGSVRPRGEIQRPSQREAMPTPRREREREAFSPKGPSIDQRMQGRDSRPPSQRSASPSPRERESGRTRGDR